MSCEISVVANIEDVDKVKKILFPLENDNGSENWLHSCKISVSTVGDLIVIANERTLVVLTLKWDFQSSSNVFQVTYKGLIHDYDKVKAVLCLTIPGQSADSKLTTDLNCIIIGYDSGYIRCYTENCDLLFEEQFHAENIVTMSCKMQKNAKTIPSLKEIYIQYQSILCTLNGQQLVSILRNCDVNSPPSNQDIASLMPKKWGFQEQSVINDSAVVGLNTGNTFDHLLTASTCGGFSTKYRTMPPNSTLVIGAGSKPFLGYHYALEGGGQPVLSDVAKAVASKLKSTLPTWLVGNKNSQEKQILFSAQPVENMGCRFGLCDMRRAATDIVLSPDNKLAAVCDTLGRILLIDSYKGIVLKIFKGYREGQCSFIQVPDERRSKSKIDNKMAHFLVVYSPKKGTVEIFSLQHCSKIATFTASKHSRLLYANYGFSGFSTSKSKHICTTLFIDNNGLIKEFLIPFHFTLSEKNNKKARDLHLYKKLRHLLKTSEELNEKILSEALSICTELKTNDIKYQVVSFLLDNKSLSADFSLSCVEYFLETTDDEEGKNLKLLCQNARVLLKLFAFASDTKNEEETIDKQFDEFPLDAEVKEMVALRKLLSLSVENETANAMETRVKFSDQFDLSPAQFISIFNYPTSNSLKPNTDAKILHRISEFLFKPYIEGNLQNFAEFQQQITESQISSKNLFELLLTYWSNRPLNMAKNLEEYMKKLFTLLNILIKISDDEIDEIEYNEISDFWSHIRNILIDSSTPFPALIAAILCKSAAQTHGRQSHLDDSSTSLNDMEVLTQEDVEWSIAIGKLEDVSLLNIILSTKPPADGPLPKLSYDKTDISLKYILQKGKGSVSELVAQWLTTTGFDPKRLIEPNEDENQPDVDKSAPQEKIMESLGLLKEQFPYSLETNCILTNMSWEYATSWQKDMHDMSLLNASISCLNNVQNLQIKQGLYQLLWNVHLKIVNENACKLINKVGKLPKERLCRQDTGLTDYQLSLFLSISTDFLDSFMETARACVNVPKEPIKFENIWENGGKPLVELAMEQRDVNFELLFLHHQLCLILLMTTTFTIKQSKPINNLFDPSIVNLFFTDLQKKIQIYSNKSDIRLNSNRIQFLLKIISASVEAMTTNESGKIYFTDHVYWMSKCVDMGKIWNLEVDSLRRYQIVQLYARGFDAVGEELIPTASDSQELGKCLLKVAAKRLSQFLVSSPSLSDNITALSPGLSKYIDSLDDEWCAPTPLEDITMLSTQVVHCLRDEESEFKIAAVLLEACKTLEDLQH
ncbi:unnamed protein product [Phyllotreta striolata]|uniref:Rab3 GTPase-activating protein non-catalytic subunit n=1 Tax=Phyllotreta striolata TaxID=444603 RepID=A0A9N9TRN1_PHYSR|nr:unnamed protein product [Phyllotreta striolata]